MRRPRIPQSALRTPLNRLLATEASVRALRELASDHNPMTGNELARRVGMEPSGVYLALNRLLREGIVRRVGSGTRGQLQWNAAHPLAASIEGLFNTESSRVDRILGQLKQIAASLAPALEAAWVQGPFVTASDTPEDPLEIGILAGSKVLGRVLEDFRSHTTEMESQEDITLEVEGVTRADLAVMNQALYKLQHVLPLFGLAPISESQVTKDDRTIHNTVLHEDHEHQQRLLAAAIAERIVSNPLLVRKARSFVAERLREASPQEQKELREWERVLRSSSVVRLRRLLEDPGETATRLRQTMPFLHALSSQERNQILARARTSD